MTADAGRQPPEERTLESRAALHRFVKRRDAPAFRAALDAYRDSLLAESAHARAEAEAAHGEIEAERLRSQALRESLDGCTRRCGELAAQATVPPGPNVSKALDGLDAVIGDGDVNTIRDCFDKLRAALAGAASPREEDRAARSVERDAER